MAAVTQVRWRHRPGGAYYDPKIAEAKTPREALRALKRRISDAVWAAMVADARRVAATAATSSPKAGPGGPTGERLCRQRGRLSPRYTGSSAKPLPSPTRGYGPDTAPTSPPRDHYVDRPTNWLTTKEDSFGCALPG
jgi:hypothetical protein